MVGNVFGIVFRTIEAVKLAVFVDIVFFYLPTLPFRMGRDQVGIDVTLRHLGQDIDVGLGVNSPLGNGDDIGALGHSRSCLFTGNRFTRQQGPRLFPRCHDDFDHFDFTRFLTIIVFIFLVAYRFGHASFTRIHTR